MDASQQTPVVPLEAGAGPDNPPCPACGEPLFGWLATQRGLRGPVSRCESCGLGVVGLDDGPEAALRELNRLGDGEGVRFANRGSFACALGSAGWDGLEPGANYLFTVEAVRRLVARRDQVVKSSRWAPLAGFLGTWQTLLNSVTFGHNAAFGALGRGGAVPPDAGWKHRIDLLASLVLAVPAALIALPVELLGGLCGRGDVVSVRFELL